MTPEDWWTVISRVGGLAAFVLFVVTCVSLIRLSVHVRSSGRRYVIHDSDREEDDERPARRRPVRRPTGL